MNPIRRLRSRFTLPFVIGLLAASSVLSQPRGDEGERIRAIVRGLQVRIAANDVEILRRPGNADLHALRGSLFIELYHALYDRTYLSAFYGDKPPDLRPGPIATQAIRSYSKALSLKPSPELYGWRGKMFAVRWHSVVSRRSWYEEIKSMGGPEWSEIFSWRTPEKEMVMFERVMSEKDFALAAADLERAVETAKDGKAASEFRLWAARLYLERARRVYSNVELNEAAVASGRNRFGYRILSDLGRAIGHIRRADGAERFKYSGMGDSWIETQRINLPAALYFKGHVAEGFGEPETALAAMNEAAKYIDVTEPYSQIVCEFFADRSRLNLQLGNTDAAITDASTKPPRDFPDLCHDSYEPRGDAYLAKGDYRAAVDDFTYIIDSADGGYGRPRAHKKRAIAWMKLGEYRKAVSDLDYFIRHAIDRGEGYGRGSEEGLLLRAEAYRKIGDDAKALDDEKAAKARIENIEVNERKGGVYGKVVMPDGSAAVGATVRITPVDGSSKGDYQIVDKRGRFVISHMPAKPHRIAATYKRESGDSTREYRIEGLLIEFGNKMEGPLILRLRARRVTNGRPAETKPGFGAAKPVRSKPFGLLPSPAGMR